MIQAIADRRSIRKYKPDMVPKELIEKILEAGILAPSSKNRQPWRFVVASGEEKEKALAAMRQGLSREKEHPLIVKSAGLIAGAENTLRIIEQAPVVIFITNALGFEISLPLESEDRIAEICNAQSIGAAIENMTLAATDLGLGSLWISDTYFAYRELMEWLGTDKELFAALAVGYAAESPSARPRKKMRDVVEWRGGALL